MRSRRSSPVSLSSSYLTLDPMGISMTVVNSAGRCSPGVTSCQAWVDTAFLLAARGEAAGRTDPPPAPPSPAAARRLAGGLRTGAGVETAGAKVNPVWHREAGF